MSIQDKVSMSITLVAGSEEDFDVICDPCVNDGQRVQATGHCIDCNVNMCVSCLKFHKKLPAVKDHVIKDKSTISQSQKDIKLANKQAENNDPLTDRCSKHPDELIKFYCNSHSTLGCSDCISLEHRSCKDISYIKDVSGGVLSSDELTQIQTELQMIVARLTSTQKRTEWIKKTANDNHSQIVSTISDLKKKINDLLDHLENEILEKASLMSKENVDKLDSNVSACRDAIGDTEELIADIDMKKKMNNYNRLFIAMKNAQSRIRDLTDEATRVCKAIKYAPLSFQPDEKLKSLLSTLTSMGDVLLANQITDFKAKYQHDINVKYGKDTEACAIVGIIVLSDGRLVLADANNDDLKLVNIKTLKVTDQIKLDSKPIDLTRITGGKIAVTVAAKRHIQIITVSPVLSKSYTIAMPGLYFGIEYVSDKLILVCRDPVSAVHICDMSGVVLQQIETDYSGNKLFTRASRIAISPDRCVMYVSDVDEHSVVSLTMEGKLIGKYTSDSIKRPIGMAVDEGGFVYVCSHDTNTVHQLSPNGQLVQILLERLVFPAAVAYNDGSLYISSGNKGSAHCNKIEVYRLGK